MVEEGRLRPRACRNAGGGLELRIEVTGRSGVSTKNVQEFPSCYVFSLTWIQF